MSNTACNSLLQSRPALQLLVSIVTAITGLTMTASAAANSVYRCESNTGVVEYSNTKPKQFASDQCKQIDLPELTTIQAPKTVREAPAQTGPTAAAPAAQGFPSVSAARQERRDKARRSILEQELKREQARLEQLQDEYKDGEPERRGDERNYQKYLDRVERLRTDISRRESSISALTEEMGALN